jgi:hypothetical protein
VRLDNLAGTVKVEVRKSDIIRATQLKSSLEVRGKGKDLDLDSILGEVSVSGSFSGTVQLRDLAKPVHLESSELQFRAEKISGDMRTTLTELVGSNIVGPIRIKASRAHDVKLNDFTQSVDIEVDRGDISLQPRSLPLGKMNVRTRNGDIDLSLPETAKFDLRGSTTHGDATNDWGDALKQDSDKHGSTLTGIIGQGPALVLTTERGGFTIRKIGAEAVPVPRKEVTTLKRAPEVRVE